MLADSARIESREEGEEDGAEKIELKTADDIKNFIKGMK